MSVQGQARAEASSSGLLTEILEATRRDLAARRERLPVSQIERQARDRAPGGDRFVAEISRSGRVNVIAECKRRSPSRGVLRAAYEPSSIAYRYQSAGAAAVSVLTEPRFFDGALEHLAAVREAVGLPVLRKDFIVDEYQLLEARAAGADAVLLISAALSGRELKTLLARTGDLGMAALVEVHDRADLDRAVDAGATLIGVNSRDLRTLKVDLTMSSRLIEHIPRGAIAVAESGIRSRDDLVRLSGQGFRAFLVGECLMASPDPGLALRELMQGGDHSRCG